MKKILNFTIYFILLLFSVSCGHTVYTSSKGLGLQVSWQPDSFVPSFRGGQYEVTSFIPRGNSNMSNTTATGGILGTGGTSQTMTVSSGIQFNEGNIAKALICPTTGDPVKMEIAKALPLMLKPPTQPASISSRTTYAAGATGPHAVLIKPDSTGTDKIVDKIAQNAQTIKDIANTTINVTGDTTKTSIVTMILASKRLLIVIVIASVIVILLLILLIKYLINHFTNRKITATAIIPPGVGKVTIQNNNQEKVPENQFISK